MKDLIIDCFAGGGGASVGIEMALGRPVDIAINHDPDAILMHKTNHPDTLHLTEDIFQVDLKKILERDTAKAVQKVDEQPYFRKHFHSYTCPVCHKKVESKWPFCGYCGQKIKREED